MDILAALVADRQPPEMVKPRHRALHDPAVPSQARLILDTLAGDADPDAAPRQEAAAAAHVVPFVGVQFLRALAPSPIRLPDRWDGGEQRLEDGRVRALGPGQPCGQRDPGPIDHHMALRARFAAIRRVLAGRRAPPFARTLALSRLARLQSMRSASPSLSSSTWWRRCHTPAACQSRRRRQQVDPLPQPTSSGRSFQRIPVWSTKMIPQSAGRSGSRRLPPCGCAGWGGRSGATSAQSSSLTNACTFMRTTLQGACHGCATASKVCPRYPGCAAACAARRSTGVTAVLAVPTHPRLHRLDTRRLAPRAAPPAATGRRARLVVATRASNASRVIAQRYPTRWGPG